MLESQHTWAVGWFGLCIIVSICLFLVLPLLVGGRFRLPYAAAISLLALTIPCVMGFRGLYSYDQAGITFGVGLKNAKEGWDLYVESGAGGILVGLWNIHTEDVATPYFNRNIPIRQIPPLLKTTPPCPSPAAPAAPPPFH